MRANEGAVVEIAIHEVNQATRELRKATRDYLLAQERLGTLADIYMESREQHDVFFALEEHDIIPWLEQDAEAEVTDVRAEVKAEQAARRLVDDRNMTSDQLAAMASRGTRTVGQFESILRRIEEERLG